MKLLETQGGLAIFAEEGDRTLKTESQLFHEMKARLMFLGWKTDQTKSLIKGRPYFFMKDSTASVTVFCESLTPVKDYSTKGTLTLRLYP